MNKYNQDKQRLYLQLKVILYAIISLISITLLSKSVQAKIQLTQLIQDSNNVEYNVIITDAEKMYDEGMSYYKQQKKESLFRAIEKWEVALKLWREVGNKEREATTLLGIGKVYSDLGDKQKAFKFYNDSLMLTRTTNDNKAQEAIILDNIGGVYLDLGDNKKAFQFYNDSLKLTRAIGDKVGQATTLNNMGKIYSNLGDHQKAFQFYNESLPLRRAAWDKKGEAITINNIGGVYSDLGHNTKALQFYNESLLLTRAILDKVGEATTLNLCRLQRLQRLQIKPLTLLSFSTTYRVVT